MSYNNENPLVWGFKIKKFLQPDRFYKTLSLDDKVPLEEQSECPAGCAPLKTVCTLVSGNGIKRVRVGQCSSCGYMGYRDRPTREWIQNFYLDSWDKTTQKSLKKKINYYKSLGPHPVDTQLNEKITPNKDRALLEIGCGYGRKLASFKSFGFAKLIGVENSRHRAEVARHAFGLTVLDVAPFENDAMQAQLRTFAPFSVIYANHVIEHLSDPAHTIALCSRLQDAGDYLIINVPNREPIGIVLLYLLHLHSFTPLTLARILARHGYTVVHDDSTPGNINLIAQKVTAREHVEEFVGANARITPKNILKRYKDGLGAGKAYPGISRILWWFKKLDFGGQKPLAHPLFARAYYLFLSKYWCWHTHKHMLIEALGKELVSRQPLYAGGIIAILVDKLERRVTSFEESPLEIQFDKDIHMLYK